MAAMFDMEKVNEMEHEMGKSARKPKDVNAPSRALSGFFLWANKMRPEVMKSCSGVAEIGKKLGAMWKKMSSSDKAPWDAKYQKAKKSYDAQMEKYKKTASYKKHQMMMLAWKIHETKKPYPKDTNAPKRNLSAYMLYGGSVRSKIVKENPEMEVKDVMREQSVWWKAISDSERKKWTEKAAEAKEKYAKKLARYMKTDDYQTWATGRDSYKAEMLTKRNKLMGIKKKAKRARSETKTKGAPKSPSKKKQKRRTARRSRTPKAPKRSAKRSTSRRRARRRSKTPKASKSKSKSRSSSRRRARTPKAPKKSRSAKRSTSRRRAKRRSRTPKASKSKSRSKSRSSSRKSKSKSPKRRKASRSKSRRRSGRKGSRKRRARKAKRTKKSKAVEPTSE